MIIKFNGRIVDVKEYVLYKNYDSISKTFEIVIKSNSITQQIYATNNENKLNQMYEKILEKISVDINVQDIEKELGNTKDKAKQPTTIKTRKKSDA